MNIDKDTKIFGSFSMAAGNNGNIFFNKKFKKYNINAIYKSFSITNIEEAVKAAECLNFSGFAVSMPFKKTILPYIDIVSDRVKSIGACNTIIREDDKWVAYNTDYVAMKETMSNFKEIIILGNGGLASATIYACNMLNIKYDIITREKWDSIKDIKNSIVINCTPVPNLKLDKSNTFIDAKVDNLNGRKIYYLQACEQFRLYTGIKIN